MGSGYPPHDGLDICQGTNNVQLISDCTDNRFVTGSGSTGRWSAYMSLVEDVTINNKPVNCDLDACGIGVFEVRLSTLFTISFHYV